MLSILLTEKELKNQKLHLVCTRFVTHLFYFSTNFFLDRMICNEFLSGVPLLLLANKQDLPDCMGVRDIRPVFQQAGPHIGRRDCLVMPVSALTGFVYSKHIAIKIP